MITRGGINTLYLLTTIINFDLSNYESKQKRFITDYTNSVKPHQLDTNRYQTFDKLTDTLFILESFLVVEKTVERYIYINTLTYIYIIKYI